MKAHSLLPVAWLPGILLFLAACSVRPAEDGGREARPAPAERPSPAAPAPAQPADRSADGQTASPAKEEMLGITDPLAARNFFRGVAARVQPVVAQINVVQVSQRQIPESPFDFFFGPQGPEPREEPRQQGLGSGVIVRQDGDSVYVLTNNHVVGESTEISILLHDQRTFQGELVGRDARMDLALVRFQTTGEIPVAVLGDSDTVRVGDWALAVGNPLGLESTVTAGIISAVGRTQGPAAVISDYIQTDAAINPGNSGGALVNIDGEVIGINTWIASPTGAFIGFGFAIPINNAKRVIDQLISRGKVEYGWLGVSIQDPLPGGRRDLRLEGRSGGLVVNVYRRSPAERAGILPGDFIYRVGGSEIANAGQLVRVVGQLPVGRATQFQLIRYGQPAAVEVTPAARGEEEQILSQAADLWPGLYAVSVDDAGADRQAAGRVILVQVFEGSPAGAAGLRAADLVQAIGGRPVGSLLDFYRLLNETRGDVRLTVLQQGSPLTVTLRR